MTSGALVLDETAFLKDGGRCGALLRSLDWSHHPLGAPTGWPSCLKTTLALLLHARQPMLLWWGPALVQFYNDAYLSRLGDSEHPGALGKPAAERELRGAPMLYPQVRAVMQRGIAGWEQDQLMPIVRDGRQQDAYWSYSYSAVFDEQGAVAGALVLFQETTGSVRARAEVKWARQEAELSRERLFNLVANVPAFVCMLSGPQHVFSMVNPVYQRLVGWDRRLIGRPLAEALPEVAAQGFGKLLDEVYTKGRIYHGREALVQLARHDDGELERAYVSFVYQPRHDADGVVDGIDVFGFDVSEQVLARQVAASAAERCRAVIDAIPAQTWTADRSGSVDFVSPKALAFFGASRTRLFGTGWLSFVHPDDLPPFLARWQQALASGDECELELRLRRVDGDYRWHLTRAVPVRDAAGNLILWIGTHTDVHGVREARAQLTRVAALERHIASVMQCELREPLREIVEGIADVGGHADLDTSMARQLRELRTAAEHAKRAVQELLDAFAPLHAPRD